jgi:hypothetical protein
VNKWPDSNRLRRQCLLAYDHSPGHLESRSQRDPSRAFRARLLGRRDSEEFVVESRFPTFEANSLTNSARRSSGLAKLMLKRSRWGHKRKCRS